MREICEDVEIITFSNDICRVPSAKGFKLADLIINSQCHGGTELGKAVTLINYNIRHDRLIVITDEQSASNVPAPAAKRGYMINVASYRNGVGYGKWTHIDGWSESVVDYIIQSEKA